MRSPRAQPNTAVFVLLLLKVRITRAGATARPGLRYYSPELGRWCSRDPIGEWGGVNLFAFVMNGAPSRVDILGLYDPDDPAHRPNPIKRHEACCKCTSVKITFTPGGNKFEWGVYKQTQAGRTTWKLGNRMRIHWTVSGDPDMCRYEQDETEILQQAAYNDGGGWDYYRIGRGGKHSVPRVYTDRMGVHLTSVGFYKWTLVGTITFRCESSDGSVIEEDRKFDDTGFAAVPEDKDPFVVEPEKK